MKGRRVAVGHFQQKAVPVDWGKGPEQISAFKDLVERANGLYAFCGQCFSVPGEQAKPAFVLEVEIDALVSGRALQRQCFYRIAEVFLKASTAPSSLLAWLLRATFIFVPK